MAFDDKTRGRLQKLVTECRGLLIDEFRIQVQQIYGLDPNTGEVTPLDRLMHLSAAERETADLLRQTLAHYLAAEGLADGADHRVPIIDRIVREQAFTVLNRLAALLMMEARGVLLPAVSQGQQSKAFELYKLVAGSALGETGQAYEAFLFSLFDEFAQELPALFDRFAPQGRLFPREAALLQVLAALNHHEVQPLWPQDETVGWIYQYFNSKEERKAMREASQAPRNSRELAVRNQFFTPRYVVEFLVDNTLGRLWFNATGGQTALRDRYQYLLDEPAERPHAALRLRDPRTLKLLDPACGSMHFGLYAFDLFIAIYREAWDWEQTDGAGCLDVGTPPAAGMLPLCQTYADRQAYLRDVPRLVIEHNIYGVDIDPRAAQIASLALWLRAQRAWHDEGVKAKDRPAVGRGHIIAATAPPAEKELREELSAQLDEMDAKLFTETLQILKGVPELGVLLRVERELPRLVRSLHGENGSLFRGADVEQWQEAEARLRDALIKFAQAARATYQGRLFAQDALQGLRLIDLCREQFDVVVMNPPFGLPSKETSSYINDAYTGAHGDIYCSFVSRALELCASGYIGCITSSSFMLSPRLESFRLNSILGHLCCLADFGIGVMDDAMVRAAAYVLSGEPRDDFLAADCRGVLRQMQIAPAPGTLLPRFSKMQREWFSSLPQARMLINAPRDVRDLLADGPYLEPTAGTAREGMKTFDNERFIRLPWEVNPSKIGASGHWRWLSKGGEFSYFYSDIHLLLNWSGDGAELKQINLDLNGSTAQVRQASTYWGRAGATYSRRSSGFSARALPEGCIFTSNGPAVLPLNDTNPLYLLGWINSRPIRAFIHLNAGAYDNYSTGALKKLPWKSPMAEIEQRLISAVRSAVVEAKIELSRVDECSRWFAGYPVATTLSAVNNSVGTIKARKIEAEKQALEIADSVVAEVYGFHDLTWADELISSGVALNKESTDDSTVDSETEVDGDGLVETSKNLLSFFVGMSFGRWINPEKESNHHVLALHSAFAELPAAPPALNCLSDSISVRGVIPVADVGRSDLVSEVRRSMRKLIQCSDDLELGMTNALGAGSLARYLSRNFFADHLQKYTRSKRQAPIYWPLSTVSGSYTLVVYYPTLTSQTLYTAVNDYLDGPSGKIARVSSELNQLRESGQFRDGASERRLEELVNLEAELRDFRDTLLQIASLYQPNCDDGVLISAAPLWTLFRHKPWQKVLKDTWSKLQKGDYDWAHLAMSYWPDRVREKCKTDKSLAIAHGMEALYVEPEATPQKTRGRKKANT
ncbi:BREX-1 system adenine-specific DNA-methyltransferase PglX [Burkholderia gladioli]|uniref:BREX-1 system adenine-specific DNA-methyltransferase PglX n=1 Tax=Burkholderia gladioli TaxID=28095 RepID=UPI00163F298B|nr:BREX-1 system adenine-specific DNA-methyltransferase PglX [Burkholderia gladioli]